ncbi:hypothetical protein [Haloarchaeobius iranensis]|uniref:PQQ-like domain-containing protein n=1 Tax=Haloarchaeobius iranensis TaxID=996166 RepID=A0A1H0B5K0_9EURY|nr:hypothetical protein [Haloarchaeobius iranensis]SDN40916.1 hypothetical protein SAMN05192554_1343 [Haloarchaeobius iranensis]
MTGQNRREFIQHSAGAAGLTSLMSVRSLLGMTPYVNERWHETFEKSDNQDAKGIIRTQDGNFVVASFSEYLGLGTWLVKFRPEGTKLWEQKFEAVDGVSTGVPWDIAEAGDGSLFVATDGEGWSVVKTTPDGEPVWLRDWLPEWDDVVDWDYPLQLAGTADGGCVVAGGIGRGEAHDDYDSMVAATHFGPDGDLVWQRAADIEHSNVRVLDITIDEDDDIHVASNAEFHFRADTFTTDSVMNQMNVNLFDDDQGVRYYGGKYTDAVRLRGGGYATSLTGAGGRCFDSEGTVIWNVKSHIGSQYRPNRGNSITLGQKDRVAVVGKIEDGGTRPGWIIVMDVEDGSVETVHRFRDTSNGEAYRKAQEVVGLDDGFAVAGLQSGDWYADTKLWVSSVGVKQDNTPDLLQTILGVGLAGAGGWAVKRWNSDEEPNEGGVETE